MAKTNVVEDAYSEAVLATDAVANIEQLQAIGQKTWRAVSPFIQDNEQWESFDMLFVDATGRIARATNRPVVERVWHHCHYLAPTPVIGTVVHCWLPNSKKVFAAHVTGILQPPGTIEIALIRGAHDQGTPEFHEPVTHTSHPQHDTKQLTKWDYLPGVGPSDGDWQVAKQDIANRERWHVEALAREEEIRKNQLAAQRAAKKQQPELVS